MTMAENLRKQTTVVKSFADVDISGLKMPMIAVFSHPADYTDKCVARLFDGDKATNIAVIGDSVEELRGDIHLTLWGLVPFARGPEDVKSLVEVWI